MKGKSMKKMMLIAAVVALAGTQIQTARAGNREWGTAGRVLTGVAAGVVIASAVDARANYSAGYYGYNRSGCSENYRYNYCPPPAPVVSYCPPPVVCYRPPVVYAPRAYCALPVVVYRYDSHRGHHRGWERSRGW